VRSDYVLCMSLPPPSSSLFPYTTLFRSSFVGTELDAIAGYALNRFTQVEAGYGHFFRGDYIKQSLSSPAFGSRDADYIYVQATEIEEHTSELQSRFDLVCRLLLEKKNDN